MSELEELRVVPKHPYDYTEFEMSARERACNEKHKEFPHLPYAWVEYVYDFVKNTNEEELNLYKETKTKSKRTIPKN